jgi:hypothetical protein
MENDKKRQQAIELLINKKMELAEGVLPKKTDFSEEEVCFIKHKLGPWPRALEAAGLKEKNKLTGKEKSKLKRERIKQSKKREVKVNE